MTPAEVAETICREAGYEFVGPVGSGAFKHTFHVREDGRSLALKLYQKGVSVRSGREITAMKRCHHTAIAKFIALKSITIGKDAYVFLLEEYLSGGSLETRVGNVSFAEVPRLALALSDAIDHIGTKDLVHRDLKPPNVMFRDAGLTYPVIVDFGLVRDLAAASLTASHVMPGPGTAMYAAPEQLNNEKGMITARTDQFGLGMTLAFVLFQTHPYARPGDSLGDAIQRVAEWEDPSPDFNDLCRNKGLEPLAKMVRSYPVDRFRTGSELVAAWRSRVS